MNITLTVLVGSKLQFGFLLDGGTRVVTEWGKYSLFIRVAGDVSLTA